jgi:predicted DNA-binding transcriptional regulator YafY
MRADRLLAMLLYLKRKKKITARELAIELEVSERTIYRDIIALSSAGFPVYTEKGPGGGIGILDGHQADLVDLNRDELNTLALLSVPQPFETLGLAPSLKSALLKLNVFQEDRTEASMQGVYFDPSGWSTRYDPKTNLQTLLAAFHQQKKVWIRYRYIREMVNESFVDILGLVAKEFGWYVVWHSGDKISVHEISAIIDLHLTAEASQIPTDFVLQDFWQAWCQKQIRQRSSFRVRLRVAKSAILIFNQIFGSLSNLESASFYADQTPAWLETEINFRSLENARYQLLGLGAAVEVLEPEILRTCLADFAEQICLVYERSTLAAKQLQRM